MLNNILKEICINGSIYDEIIDNIIRPNYHLKPELISEIAISFLENREKIENVIKDGYFLYYFIRVVKNNVHSKTSPFHKNVRIKDNLDILNNIEIEDTSSIDELEETEKKFQQIDKIFVTIPKTHFQNIIWNEYYYENKTLREIGKKYEVSHCLVFHEIKKIKDEIKRNVT